MLFIRTWPGGSVVHNQATGTGKYVLPIPRRRGPRTAGFRSRCDHRVTYRLAWGLACFYDGAFQEAGGGGGGGGGCIGEPKGDQHVQGGRAHHTGGSQAVGEFVCER